MSKTKEWKEKNSKAQLIAQNKPEQKAKNAAGVKKARENASVYKAWITAIRKNANSPEWRKKQAEAMKRRWKNPSERTKFLQNGRFHTSVHGIFCSKYSGEIRYESSYELMFLFTNDLSKNKVRRFDLPILYLIEGKKHFYFPDFIIEKTIFEIKSHATLKNENKELYFEAKNKAIQKFIQNSEIYSNFQILFDEELVSSCFLNLREYIYSWLLKDGFLKETHGGKGLRRNLDYNDENNYNNKKFKEAKEIYKKWKSLIL